MKRLWSAFILPLLSVSACGQAAPQDQPSSPPAQVAAMIDSLYKKVIALHPLSTPDRRVFGPYLSTGLLHSFDLDGTCSENWLRQHPDPDLKPEVGLLELGVFSGSADETDPQTFHIEKVETEKDGSYHAHVKLTYTEDSYTLTWYVVAVVIFENGRPVVDDVVYLKQENLDERRLGDLIAKDCKDVARN